MRRIAAHYIFPNIGKPIKNGYVELNDDGVVVSVGELDSELESTEFYNGILIPGMVSVIDEMRLLQDKYSMSLEEIIKHTTLDRAKAIGADSLSGSFEVGKRPGVINIDGLDLHNLKLTDKSKSIRII